jgi:cob(I)alamin adenosyltransferase
MIAETDEDARHKAKMVNRKAVQDAEVAGKTIEKGLLIVHTGKGKGKSTAAFGLLLRAIGRGFQCGVVQFGKGAWQSGERSAIELLVLDELNISLRYDHIELAKVLAAFVSRRPGLHVVVTGRNAKPELIEMADLVTEMVAVKHHFAAGVKAQLGIEF